MIVCEDQKMATLEEATFRSKEARFQQLRVNIGNMALANPKA